MKLLPAFAACALTLPAMAPAATRTFDTAAFEAVSVAAGIQAQITPGTRRSVVAETSADHFDDLRIVVKDNVLHIDRPPRSWFWFRRRPDYQVRVTAPKLRSVNASSGARVTLQGKPDGDLALRTSSGATLEASMGKGGTVQAQASSGSRLQIAGACTSLDVGTSSGAQLDAEDLDCENVVVKASSGSNVSVTARRSIRVAGSSGSNTRVRGKPATVQADKSSGASVVIR